MADLNTDIQQISQAEYGEEVRDSIVDALSKMNTETEAATKNAADAEKTVAALQPLADALKEDDDGNLGLNDFVGPTQTEDGKAGKVPKPLAGQQGRVLTTNGWTPPSEIEGLGDGKGGTTSVFSRSKNGLAPSASAVPEGEEDQYYLGADARYHKISTTVIEADDISDDNMEIIQYFKASGSSDHIDLTFNCQRWHTTDSYGVNYPLTKLIIYRCEGAGKYPTSTLPDKTAVLTIEMKYGTTKEDGKTVTNYKKEPTNVDDLHKYKETPFVDKNDIKTGTTYCYRIVGIFHKGDLTTNDDKTIARWDLKNARATATAKKKTTNESGTQSIYGFRIDQSKTATTEIISDIPSPKLPLENEGYTAHGHMNFDTGVFDYGSFNKTSWIFPKSCLLSFDGQTKTYLKSDNETLTESGDDFDPTDSSLDGNIMVEFGDIWVAFDILSNDVIDVYLANYNASNDDLTFYNQPGHWYMAKYMPSLIDGKLRSLSGKTNYNNAPFATQADAAYKNNPSYTGSGGIPDSTCHWAPVTFLQWVRIMLLSWLVGYNTDTQAVYGSGLASYSFTGGVCDVKGDFYGKSNSGLNKIFGFENPWGYCGRRIFGCNGSSGVELKVPYKCSELAPHSTSIEGFTTSSGYVSKYAFDKRGFMYPKSLSGSSSSGFADYVYGGSNVAMVGCGSSYDDLPRCGVSAAYLDYAASYANSFYGSSLSYTD